MQAIPAVPSQPGARNIALLYDIKVSHMLNRLLFYRIIIKYKILVMCGILEKKK
jgi:hypothetical protein